MKTTCPAAKHRLHLAVASLIGMFLLVSSPVLAQEDLPSSFDWRNATVNIGTETAPQWVTGDWVTPVRNQGGCGSCWAFGALAAMEARMKLCAGDPTWNPDLSEQHLVCDCSGGGTCGGGWHGVALGFVRDQGGVAFESELPYRASDTSPYWPLADDWSERSATLSHFTQLNKVGEEWILKQNLIEHGPLSSGHHEWSHVVALVGYEDTNPEGTEGHWIFKNSWGAGWNGDGYGTIPYGELTEMSGIYALDGDALDQNSIVATWAGSDSDTWHSGENRWTNRFQTAVYQRPTPLEDTFVNVHEGVVTISEADAAAKRLTLDGGTVSIEPGRTLSSGAVDVSSGGVLHVRGTLEVAHGKTIAVMPGGTCTVENSSTLVTESIDVAGGVLNIDPGSLIETTTFISGTPGATDASCYVPTDNSLGTTWTEWDFVEQDGWTVGKTGIGYEDSGNDYADLIGTTVRPQDHGAGCTSTYLRIPFTVADAANVLDLTLRMKYDDGFVAYLNGEELARSNVTGTPSFNTHAAGHDDSLAAVFEDIDVSAHLGALRSGANVLAIHGINSGTNSSDMLVLPELVAVQDADRLQNLNLTDGTLNLQGADLKVGTLTVAGGVVDCGENRLLVEGSLNVGNTHLTAGDGDMFAVSGSDLFNAAGIAHNSGTLNITADPILETVTLISGTPNATRAIYYVPTDDSLGTAWSEVGFSDNQNQWTAGYTGIGYEDSGSDYADLIKTTVRPQDQGPDCTSTFIRIPFTGDSLGDVAGLTLRMKYDDGFVAYLNGVEVHRANFSYCRTPSFDSEAGGHPDSQATEFEDIDISAHLDRLNPEGNVLAIHGMNSDSGSSDMLILPELVAVRDSGETPTATVPDLNITGGTVRLDGTDLSVVTMTVTGGVIDTGTNRVVIDEGLQLGDVRLSFSGSKTFTAAGLIRPDSAELTLAGGTLSAAGIQVGPKRVLLVSDEVPGGRDDSLVALIESLGYIVDTSGMGGAYRDDQAPFNDQDKVDALDDADLILASRNASSTRYDNYPLEWNGLATPLVLMSGFLARGGESQSRWGWVSGGCSEAGPAEDSLVVEPGKQMHPFVAGLTSPVQVFDWTDAPEQEAPSGIHLPAPGTPRDADHLIGTFDGCPLLIDVPAGFDLDQGGSPEYGTTGQRRAFLGHWNYNQGDYDFDDFITADFGTLLANVLTDMFPWSKASPLQMPGTNLAVIDDSIFHFDTTGIATLGNLSLQSDVTLTVSGAALRLRNVDAGHPAAIQGDVLLRGALSPGDGCGTLTIDGNLQTEDGFQFLCELDSSTCDRVDVTGNVQLDQGTLVLQPLGRFSAIGDLTRTIITADGISGIFPDALFPEDNYLGYGVFYEGITYGQQALDVHLLQAAVGDGDGNRSVDFGDVWSLLTSGLYNVPDPDPPAIWTQGDFSNDGLVDFADVWELLTSGHYNQGDYTAKGTRFMAIPEPSMLVLLLMGAAGLLVHAWGTKSCHMGIDELYVSAYR